MPKYSLQQRFFGGRISALLFILLACETVHVRFLFFGGFFVL